ALRVPDDEVVLAWVGADVIVEAARVGAAVFRQAHRQVAVVVDDRTVEALADRRGDPAEVRHRHGEDDDRVDPALTLDRALEMALPPRGDVTPDGRAHRSVPRRVARLVLRP